MKCFIIDDEPLARKGLKEFIEQTPNLECVGEANNPLDALADLAVVAPDLIFLDIQMPKMTGLEFVQNFKPEAPIIYTTAFSEYAVESYDLDVKDYLLKPLQYDRFLRAVARVYKSREKRKVEESDLGSFFVKSEGSMKKVMLIEIKYLKSIQNYVKIYTDKGSVLVHRTLKSFEIQLPTQSFLKVQKSYLVNLNKVDRFDGYLLYFGKEAIPVSRNMVKKVKQVLMNINCKIE